MWEVMICTNAENKRINQYIYKMMKKLVQDKSCVLTTHKDDKNYYILFACANGKKDYYKEMIKLCIIDYIINVYKYEFLIKKIHNFLQDEVAFKSFIKLLSLYDKQTDEIALKKALKIEKVFYVDSFIQFRLEPLKKHWQELCFLAEDNFDSLICSESFLDIMRFLIATMEESCDKIKILLENNKYSVYNVTMGDSADKIDECNTPFSLISTVLKICPRQIEVYSSSINEDLGIKFLQSVYGERLIVLK